MYELFLIEVLESIRNDDTFRTDITKMLPSNSRVPSFFTYNSIISINNLKTNKKSCRQWESDGKINKSDWESYK